MEKNRRTLDLILGLTSEGNRVSTLQLALEQARHLIGFDKEKGVTKAGYNNRKLKILDEHNGIDAIFLNDDRSNTIVDVCDAFSALSLYLIILDQLGSIFTPRKNDLKIREFLSRLKVQEFEGKDDQTTKRIHRSVACLRNSLCHDFGLVGKTNNDESFRFVLDFGDNDDIVKFPEKHWNGNCGDKSEETQTTIYVFPLCNAIESAIRYVIGKYTNNELTCALDEEELKARFTVNIIR